MTVTLTANAGVILELGGYRIWVDALHDRKTPPFSTVDGELWQKIRGLHAPDYILYTHCHPDHYSEKLTQEAHALWPRARIIAPEGKFKGPLSVADGGLKIDFMRLPHEGEQYKDVLHYGISITAGGKTVLHPGDCALAALELAGRTADVLLLDFPWMTTTKGRRFLEAHYPQAEKVLLHLPFAADDRFGYRTAAARCQHVHILQDALETVTL